MAVVGYITDGLVVTKDILNSLMLQAGNGVPATVVSAAGDLGRAYIDTNATAVTLYYDNGASWVAQISTDPGAGTGGFRTLGTGAAQAAAGDHTHTPTSLQAATLTDEEEIAVNDGVEMHWLGITNAIAKTVTASPAFAGSNRTRVISGFAAVGHHDDNAAHNVTLELEVNNSQVASTTFVIAANGTADKPDMFGLSIVYVEPNATSGQQVDLNISGDDAEIKYLTGFAMTQQFMKV